ncbi:MAG: retron system putative HNH endonuclease [Desulfovibrionaceae bacterium]|nr:retron system putative HNH endonuclease [Desulfovibrionaceae bacterium]
MNSITKKHCPPWLSDIRKTNPERTYGSLSTVQRKKLRAALIEEQGYVCCFCGDALGMIDGRLGVDQGPVTGLNHNIRIAHLKPQSAAPDLTLDYDNMCASCESGGGKNGRGVKGEKHCDLRQGDRFLPVEPTQEDCLSYFAFGTDGSIYPNPNKSESEQEKARETIEILGLNSEDLRQKRVAVVKHVHQCLLKDRSFLNRIAARNELGCHMPFYFAALSYYGRSRT